MGTAITQFQRASLMAKPDDPDDQEERILVAGTLVAKRHSWLA